MVNPNEDTPPKGLAELAQELRDANAEWARALAQRDKEALDHLMADDFVLAYPFEGDDKAQFIADVVAGVVTVDSLEPRDATVRAYGDTGLVFGSETAKWAYKGRDLSGHYRFFRVFARRDDRWQIIALHVCALDHR